MSLTRVGGKSDGGVDLQGWWWLPPLVGRTGPPLPFAAAMPDNQSAERTRLRVLAQCKAEKKKFSPNYVREMEGVLYRYLAQSTTPRTSPAYPLVAILISESAFTSATLLRAQSSPVPFVLLHLPPAGGATEGGNDTRSLSCLGGAFWNPALSSHRGILRGQMELRWERAAEAVGRPGLWWQGKRLQNWTPDRASEMEEGFEVPKESQGCA
ncbi:hypothetical protein HWV62_39005 [Athelia sp. TMB]|nr:hypothetical protein HWV62_39005 [Athelia sp. TMB]